MRLIKNQIDKINEFSKSGRSLNWISNKLSLPKTTVYYHFRKIRRRTIEPINLSLKDLELVGEFIGLFAGDGGFFQAPRSQYRVHLFFNQTERKFIEDLISHVLMPLFNKKPHIFKHGSALKLHYSSKKIYQLITNYLVWDEKSPKTYTIRLKERACLPREFVKGFIRGSLDSDGHFSDKRITFSSVSPLLIEDISWALDLFNIQHAQRVYIEKRENRKNLHYIEVGRIKYNSFVKIISPRNKTMCTGRDSNPDLRLTSER